MSNHSSFTQIIEALTQKLGSAKVLTTGPRYDEARRVWNSAVAYRPAMIVFCEDTSDVQSCVEAARTYGVSLSVRGGGYDWAGRALRGDLVVDLTRMHRVVIDGEVASVGGGAASMAVAEAASRHRLLAVTGIKGGVGMAGLTLGGGYGHFTGRFGMALDNLLGAEVVLADGQVVETDAEHEPDLFWAIRGGGGNFGAVTNLKLRLHPVAEVSDGAVVFPWDHSKDVLAVYDALVPALPDELTLTPTFFAAPDGELSLVVHHAWCGNPSEDDRMIELVKDLGMPKSVEIKRKNCADMLKAADRRELGEGVYRMVRTVTLAGLNRQVIEIIAEAMEQRSSPLSWIGGHPFYGAGERIPLASTAFGIRSRHFMLGIYAAWTSNDAAPHRAWAEGVEAALKPYAMPSAYPNYFGADRPEQAAVAYGPNARRLLQLKARYDPTGMFAAIALPTSA